MIPTISVTCHLLDIILAGSFLAKLQRVLQKKMGFAIPVFWGDVPFAPLLPKRPSERHGLGMYIGGGLELPKISEPTQADVDKWHAEYCTFLRAHFDQWKEHAGCGGWELEIVADSARQ